MKTLINTTFKSLNLFTIISVLLTAYCLLHTANCYTQAPEIEWQNTIGGYNTDNETKIISTTDGGFMVIGSSYSKYSGDKTEINISGGTNSSDIWIIKLDINGNIEWQNTIGGTKWDNGKDIIQTLDGGYLIGAESSSGISGDKTEGHYSGGSFGYDLWIIKIDASGNIEWQNNIGGMNDDFMRAVCQNPDGTYIIGSYSLSGSGGDKTVGNNDAIAGSGDIWLLKLNATGSIIWQRDIGGDMGDYVDEIKMPAGGGYILGGASASNTGFDKSEDSYGGYDVWIIKTDNDGFVDWDVAYGGNLDEHIGSIELTADGGYLVGAYSASGISGNKTESTNGGSDYWILDLDAAGNINWQKDIGGAANDMMHDIVQLTDETIICGGLSYSGISGDKTEPVSGLIDIWLCGLDISGNLLWENTVGGSSDDLATSINECPDGNFIVAGSSSSDISGDKTEMQWSNTNAHDYWIIKFIGDVCTIPTGLYTNNIFTTKATANWNLIPGADSYQIWYREVGAGTWIKKSSFTNFKTIKLLTPDTDYEYKVRSKCSDGSFTDFSAMQNFTTMPLRMGEFEEGFAIDVYPNPASDVLNISMENYSEAITITMFDMTGNKIKMELIEQSGGLMKFDISSYPKGIYILDIIDQNKHETIRFVCD
ncbi:MAG: T9SS type A sorting domain-containing protein [Chitinophagales bacterium]